MVDETTRAAYEIALRAALRDQARATATVEFFREKLGLADANLQTVIGPGEQEDESTARDVGPVPVTDSEFYGMSQTKAAAAFLERAGRHRPQRTEAIVSALQKGGIKFGGKDPVATFYTILNRHSAFHNVGRSTWGLSVWYPNAKKVSKDTSTIPAPAAQDRPAADEPTSSEEQTPTEP